MKIPREGKKYCPYCKKHTLHKIKYAKGALVRPKTRKYALKWGARHQFELESGYGGFPRPIPHEKAKTTAKAGLKFTCEVCKKIHYKRHPKRIRRVEQI